MILAFVAGALVFAIGALSGAAISQASRGTHNDD